MHIVRDEIRDESWQLIKKQKSYSKSKKGKQMSKIFSLKIHKGIGIFKKSQNLSK